MDQAGAEAGASAFLEALNYAGETGRTEPLRSNFVDFCTRCEAIADGIDATYEAGGSIQGGAWILQRFRFYAIEGDVAVLDAFVDYTPQTWQETANSRPATFTGEEDVLKAFNLRYDNSAGWRVSALDPDS